MPDHLRCPSTTVRFLIGESGYDSVSFQQPTVSLTARRRAAALIASVTAIVLLAPALGKAAEPEQIPLIGSEGPAEDACIGVGTIRTLDPDLPIRERPDEYAREKDRLPSATLVWICEKGEGANGDEWQGIVYPTGEFQELGDCQVSAPVAAPEPYAGPCRSGWVLARDLRLVLG